MSDITDLCQIIHRGIGLNFEDLAEEIIAAGFHRDRTVTTVEELDALPDGSVVLNADGDALQNNGEIWWLMGSSTPNTSGEVEQFDGPVTLIHEGARDE